MTFYCLSTTYTYSVTKWLVNYSVKSSTHPFNNGKPPAPCTMSLWCNYLVLCTGFGHMAPSTFSGRLFCIFYALLGIPLCIVTLKAVGERINQLLENLFILISSKSQLRQEKRTKVKVLIASAGSVLALLLLGGLLYYSEDWTYFEGVYYCFIGNSSFNQ